MGKNNRSRRAQKKRKKARKSKAFKKVRINGGDISLGPVLREMQNPFAGLNNDERMQAIKEIAKSNEEMYQDSLTKIRDILQRYDPVILMSIMAQYGLTVGVGVEGIQKKDSDFQIHQAHVEILQALALQIKPEELQRQPFGPDVVQEAWDAVKKLMLARNFKDLSRVAEDDSQEEKAVLVLQQWMKANTQMVRNWGYFSQVKAISAELYGHFDTRLQEVYGFSASNIIDLFNLIIKEIEKAISNRLQSLSMLHKSRNKIELVHKYYELIGEPAAEAKEFIQKIDIKSIPFQSLFAMMMSHYDLRLHDSYEFSPKVLSDKLGADEVVVQRVLDTFSYNWGDLESYETEYLYLSNPVWFRPLIKIDANKYFCVLPQVFFSFIIPSLDRLIENIDRTALSDRRANYLEDKIVEIINRRFPEANTVSGVKWKFGNVEYETDLITFIDSHAVIVEAKSGKVSEPALRGAPARLKRHIEEILVAPNIQSKRLKERMEQLIRSPAIEDELRDKLPVNLNSIHKIIRVSVSLENFASIQANIAQLRETGWLPEGFEPCPTMTLADFETLFDFLEHPVQIIHYLERRQELEADIGYIGDELDLMGLYIGTLLNMGDIDSNLKFMLVEMSSPLDAYYNSRDAGVALPKPQPKISPLFSGIMDQLERRHTPRWTEIGVILNRFSPDDQIKLTRMIAVLTATVQKNWMIEDHKNMVIIIPPKASKYALCYVLYNNNNAQKRDYFIQGAAKVGLEAEHVEQCLVIAKNLDKDDLHYHFIGLME